MALLGFSAVIAQIVLMRELIVVFNGNEISLGIMLATWLFWTAAGSSFCSKFLPRNSDARRVVASLECIFAVALPVTIWALRASKSILQTVPGELVGPLPMLVASLVSLSVVCFASGALFVAAARLYKEQGATSARFAVSSAYLLDAAGSGIGGLLAGIVLLRFFQPFQIAAIVLVLNLAMAAHLCSRTVRRGTWALMILASLAAVILIFRAAPPVEHAAQMRLWRGFHLVAARDSIYSNLAVTETGNIRSIYSNGSILANAPDKAAAEEAVHYALLEHPSPRRILMIGGGVNGSIAEALKHPSVERIDYVELDPALIGMTRQFFPAQASKILADPRVHTHYMDGRRYLLTTGERFDVIILNAPDPETAQLNRFYTVEFFRSARHHLAPGGLLALELRASEETISPNLAAFLRCVQRTLQEVFPHIAVLPGDTLHFFASEQGGSLTEDPQVLIARLKERKLETDYVREYFIPYRMMPDRMAQIHEQLQPLASTPVNRDFAPVAYYFNNVLWSAQFHPASSNWFRAAARISYRSILAAVLLVTLAVGSYLAFVTPRSRRARRTAAFSVAATGFTMIALQILLLLAFQAIYGFVYRQLTILIAMGMAGMAVGSWLGIRRTPSSSATPDSDLAATQLLLMLSSPALIFAFSLLARTSGAAATWLAAQCAFPALAALSGVLGGYQFSVATRIYSGDGANQPGLGALYAIDLIGGCLGALLLSAYLIPLFGFWKTAWLCAAMNLAPTLAAIRVRGGEKMTA